ncbi:MAG: AzlD domain-containing protein [Lachnospiraceae bacterium]|nr:AzlD domain-containing protein [Lachnospiraceae bacterium]
MSTERLIICILVMAGTTYAIRVLPLVLFRREIKSPFVKSFLFYIPFACLAAMTFPEILTATDSYISAAIALIVASILAFWKRSLLTVALAACVTVLIVERILVFLPG